MFIDTAKILIKAGNGGNGAVTFHREKYIAAGGPDGGNGGHGGNVVLTADKNMDTLMDFRYKKKYAAEDGGGGKDGNRNGKNGADLVIKVPCGTLVKDSESGRAICDLRMDGESFVIAKGGTGGWGNARFATATRQTPKFAKSGLPGDEREIVLELKLIAAVGLLGFPNVGKSTFLSIVSDARPKIANYHFTTLVPNLGVVDMKDGSFAIADIPGIIEGAHEGVGLGHDFLRHVERTRLLLHVVDVSGSEGRDPIEDFKTINQELAKYSPKLAQKPQIVAANKMDLPGFSENIDAFRAAAEELGYPVYEISAATKQGVDHLLNKVYETLSTLPEEEWEEDVDFMELEELRQEDTFRVFVDEDGAFVVEGLKAQKIVGSTNFDDYESLQYFQRALRKSGIIKALEDEGVQEGDLVRMHGVEFDYIP